MSFILKPHSFLCKSNIINPFLNLRISANHDEVIGFLANMLKGGLFLYCRISFVVIYVLKDYLGFKTRLLCVLGCFDLPFSGIIGKKFSLFLIISKGGGKRGGGFLSCVHIQFTFLTLIFRRGYWVYPTNTLDPSLANKILVFDL